MDTGSVLSSKQSLLPKLRAATPSKVQTWQRPSSQGVSRGGSGFDSFSELESVTRVRTAIGQAGL